MNNIVTLTLAQSALWLPKIVGDTVKISGNEGKVIYNDLRYTKLEADDANTLIPNSKLFTDPVTVFQENK